MTKKKRPRKKLNIKPGASAATSSDNRERLPTRRPSFQETIFWKPYESSIEEHKIEVGVGLYSDGRPGEVFTVARKSQLDEVLSDASVIISYCLQIGGEIDKLQTLVGRNYVTGNVASIREQLKDFSAPISPIGAIIDLLSKFENERKAG